MDLEAGDLEARLAAAGVFEALAARGFRDPEVVVEPSGHGLPRVTVSGRRDGGRHVLLEALLGETVVAATFFARYGHPLPSGLDLVLVYWLREEDPTRAFAAGRPGLPLQRHPGLGCLRRAFRAVVSLAAGRGKDGVAAVPKLFHDAVLFHRSRLFLFVDPVEQGRFEAMLRDLAPLPLGEASLAFAAGCVGERGETVAWTPGLLLFPLSDAATSWLHSSAYASAVTRAADAARFEWDAAALAEARRNFATPAG